MHQSRRAQVSEESPEAEELRGEGEKEESVEEEHEERATLQKVRCGPGRSWEEFWHGCEKQNDRWRRHECGNEERREEGRLEAKLERWPGQCHTCVLVWGYVCTTVLLWRQAWTCFATCLFKRNWFVKLSQWHAFRIPSRSSDVCIKYTCRHNSWLSGDTLTIMVIIAYL